MSLQQAIVKSVVSGDTIVLTGKSASGPPQEINITLASLQAPKLSKGPQQTSEDAFSWQSREFLRKLCIGKRVAFRVIYCVTSINRNFGDVFLLTPDGTQVSLARLVVAEGWAAVKDSRKLDDNVSADHEALIQLSNSAREKKIGIFSKDSPLTRTVQWAPTSAVIDDLFARNRQKPVRAIIEYVRDGASLRVVLLDSFTYLGFSLAGVVCPRVGNGREEEDSPKGPKGDGPEPFGPQAKFFTELRLLNREVDVVMLGVDRTGNVLGTVLHPKGDIGMELIRSGLARVADRTLALLSIEGITALRAAENDAKAQRRCVWANYKPPTPSPAARTFSGVVSEVISGDTFVVVEGANIGEGVTGPIDLSGPETRITLSSIRVPRCGGSSASGKVEPSEPWGPEARDFLKQKLLGKKVSVRVEFERPGGRLFGSAKYGSGSTTGRGRNISSHLLSEGLATCVTHRADELRATEYDLMLLAQAEAIEAKNGLHGTAPPTPASSTVFDPTSVPHDLTNDAKKAKTFVSAYLKGKVLKAQVLAVLAGGRVKLWVPSEGCLFFLALSLVRVPSKTDPSGVEHPFSENARKLTKLLANQRGVEVEVDDVDKNGVVFGRVYFLSASGASRRRSPNMSPSLCVSLVELGLAKVDRRYASLASDSGDREREGRERVALPSNVLSEIQELLIVQKNAQSSLLGMWTVPALCQDPAPAPRPERRSGGKEKEASEDDKSGEKLQKGEGLLESRGIGKRLRVKVQQVLDPVCVSLVVVDEAAAEAQAKIQALLDALPTPSLVTASFHKGQFVAVNFSETPTHPKKLYRGKVDSLEGSFLIVNFIDIGIWDRVAMTDAQPLPPHCLSVPHQAQCCELACLSSAPELNLGQGIISELAMDRIHELVVVENESAGEGKEEGEIKERVVEVEVAASSDQYELVQVLLYPSSSEQSVNYTLVREGLATVCTSSRGKESRTFTSSGFLNTLKDAQRNARSDRLNLFRYGDPPEGSTV